MNEKSSNKNENVSNETTQNTDEEIHDSKNVHMLPNDRFQDDTANSTNDTDANETLNILLEEDITLKQNDQAQKLVIPVGQTLRLHVCQFVTSLSN